MRTEDQSPREQLARRLGMTYGELGDLIFNSESARLASLGRISTDEHWESVRRSLDLSPEEFNTVPLEFWGGDRLDSELIDYIRSLRPGYKTALLSNAWDDLRAAIETRWKIADVFDVIVISAEVGLIKPDPRIYQLMVERLNVPATEVIFIDDFTENVAGARSVGLHAIHFDHSVQVRQELEKFLYEK